MRSVSVVRIGATTPGTRNSKDARWGTRVLGMEHRRLMGNASARNGMQTLDGERERLKESIDALWRTQPWKHPTVSAWNKRVAEPERIFHLILRTPPRSLIPLVDYFCLHSFHAGMCTTRRICWWVLTLDDHRILRVPMTRRSGSWRSMSSTGNTTKRRRSPYSSPRSMRNTLPSGHPLPQRKKSKPNRVTLPSRLL